VRSRGVVDDGRTLYLSLPPYVGRVLREPEPLAAVADGRFETDPAAPGPAAVFVVAGSLFPASLCVIEAGEVAPARAYGLDVPACGPVACAPEACVPAVGAPEECGPVGPGAVWPDNGPGGVRTPLGTPDTLPAGMVLELGTCTEMRSAPHFKQYLAVIW